MSFYRSVFSLFNLMTTDTKNVILNKENFPLFQELIYVFLLSYSLRNTYIY